MKVKAGDNLVCVNNMDYDNLTEGKMYKAASDERPGIFGNNPYVVVMDDHGLETVCHKRRFEVTKNEK